MEPTPLHTNTPPIPDERLVLAGLEQIQLVRVTRMGCGQGQRARGPGSLKKPQDSWFNLRPLFIGLATETPRESPQRPCPLRLYPSCRFLQYLLRFGSILRLQRSVR